MKPNRRMKISTLIKDLQNYQRKYGNIDVSVPNVQSISSNGTYTPNRPNLARVSNGKKIVEVALVDNTFLKSKYE
jgi:hypothetical protein